MHTYDFLGRWVVKGEKQKGKASAVTHKQTVFPQTKKVLDGLVCRSRGEINHARELNKFKGRLF